MTTATVTTYQEQTAARTQALDVQAKAIAAALSMETGQSWTMVARTANEYDNDWFRWLTCPDPACAVAIDVDRRREDRQRLDIRGSCGQNNLLVDHLPHNRHVPHITVARSKSAARIARDMARRLLPAWQPIYNEVVERAQAHEARQAKQRAVLTSLAAACGEEVRDAWYASTPATHVHHYIRRGDSAEGRLYVGVHVDSATRVDLKIEGLTEGQAAHILGYLEILA